MLSAYPTHDLTPSFVAHHLLLCLGTGPFSELNGPEMLRKRKYRTTHYALSSDLSTQVETPFVGEALVRLLPERTFTHLHLFGTRDSMWDTLLLHLLGGEASETDEMVYLNLNETIDEQMLEEDDPDLARLAEVLGERFGLRVHLHVLELPRSETLTWTMLNRMARLPGLGSKDTVSVDLTHGLRVQPIFLLLAARYLMAVHPGLTLRHVFYGAFDLSTQIDTPEGPLRVSPIQDLQAHVALLDWIEAARAFDRYGDAGPVADLLGDHRAKPLQSFAQRLQLNTAGDLRGAAAKVEHAYKTLAPQAPIPFTLLEDRLLELPRQLAKAPSPWQSRLLLAERHAQAQNLGLAFLAAVDAVLDRVAEAYGLDEEARYDAKNQAALKAIAGAWNGPTEALRPVYDDLPHLNTFARLDRWKDANLQKGQPFRLPFSRVFSALNTVRNSVAHTSDGAGDAPPKPSEVFKLVYERHGTPGTLFDYLREVMDHPNFGDIVRVLHDWRRALPSRR